MASLTQSRGLKAVGLILVPQVAPAHWYTTMDPGNTASTLPLHQGVGQ